MTATLLYAYYENPQMLREHLNIWAHYRYDARMQTKFIIVDDGSPRNPACPIVRKFRDDGHDDLDIRVLRIVPNIPWNQDGARNLGMRVAHTEWVYMTDMDHVVPVNQIEKLLNFANHEAKEGEYYMPASQIKLDGTVLGEHPNSYLFSVRDYWMMGGYDETFAGWYGSDGNFRKNMRAGLKEVQTSAWHTVVYRKEDVFDACTHDFGRKDSPLYRANAPHLEVLRRSPAYKPKNHLRFDWFEETV